MNKIIKIPVILILLSLFFIINTSKLFSEITFNGAFKRNQMNMIEKGTDDQLLSIVILYKIKHLRVLQ